MGHALPGKPPANTDTNDTQRQALPIVQPTVASTHIQQYAIKQQGSRADSPHNGSVAIAFHTQTATQYAGIPDVSESQARVLGVGIGQEGRAIMRSGPIGSPISKDEGDERSLALGLSLISICIIGVFSYWLKRTE